MLRGKLQQRRALGAELPPALGAVSPVRSSVALPICYPALLYRLDLLHLEHGRGEVELPDPIQVEQRDVLRVREHARA